MISVFLEDYWEQLGSVDILKYEDMLLLILVELGEDLLMVFLEIRDYEFFVNINFIELNFGGKSFGKISDKLNLFGLKDVLDDLDDGDEDDVGLFFLKKFMNGNEEILFEKILVL